ncbi:hypothetical protein [Oleiagrimonas sp.]|jgi:hypothetical protein|uniref:hypothetical protein n=1 Tax=Oleiagrimonas sp. TaxID=2010330 RepID=UPI0026116066|nr:hypothetical protein [Oleiagrimonas sp.]MDA3914196.1 hypothetical protein [Oleiagrimonas sp.]
MFKQMIPLYVLVLAFLSAIAMARPAQADTLLMKRVQKEHRMQLPTRGMTMAQVERRFGKPTRKLAARGGDTTKRPIIHRWEYPGYIVYFERNHVIHSVLNTPAGNNRHPAAIH